MEKIKEHIDYIILLSFIGINPNADLTEMRCYKNIIIDYYAGMLLNLARENNTILGRVIRFPVGNSYALYLISNIRNDKVDIVWINYGFGLQDGLKDDRFTEYGEISLEYAMSKVQEEEALGDFYVNNLYTLRREKIFRPFF